MSKPYQTVHGWMINGVLHVPVGNEPKLKTFTQWVLRVASSNQLDQGLALRRIAEEAQTVLQNINS